MENLLFNLVKVNNLKGFKLFIKIELMDGEKDTDFSMEELDMLAYLNKSSIEYSTIISYNTLYISEFYNHNNDIIDDVESLKKEIEGLIQKSTSYPVALDESLSFNEKLEVYYEVHQSDEDVKEDEIQFCISACPVHYVETNEALQDWSDYMISDFLENYYFSELMESCFGYSNYGYTEDSFVEIKLEQTNSIEEVINKIKDNDLIEFIEYKF